MPDPGSPWERENPSDGLGYIDYFNRNKSGDVMHGCEMCDGEDVCTCLRGSPLNPYNPALRESVARAIFATYFAQDEDSDKIASMWSFWEDERKKAFKQADAAIAAIAKATETRSAETTGSVGVADDGADPKGFAQGEQP